jgi:hypothetical protein
MKILSFSLCESICIPNQRPLQMRERPFDFIVRRIFREEVTLKLTFPWRRGHLPRIAAKDRETVFVSGAVVCPSLMFM